LYSDLANTTGALQIWPEHRYYAESAPFLPQDDLEHFTVEQALVDHIEVVLAVQKLLNMDRMRLDQTTVSCLLCNLCVLYVAT